MIDFSQYRPLSQQIEQNKVMQYNVDQARRADEFKREQAALEEAYRQQQLGLEQRGMNLREKALEQNLMQQPNLPAALQITNEYLKAKQTGDMDRVNAIERFAKTVDRNLEYSPEGILTSRQGIPESLQDLEYAKTVGRTTGKEQGQNIALLQDVEAYMPKLEETTKRLSSLGKLATYTMAGQTRDALIRQLGFEVPDSAIARTEYISTVDNEILPLLRQTFGAAFTEKEGNSLRATLGDPNKSPIEKDAVLRAFINNKRTQVEALQRRTGSSLYQKGEQEFNNKKQGNLQNLSNEELMAIARGE